MADGDALHHLRPELHEAAHLVAWVEATGFNPRFLACWAEEYFIGRIAALAKVTNARPPQLLLGPLDMPAVAPSASQHLRTIGSGIAARAVPGEPIAILGCGVPIAPRTLGTARSSEADTNATHHGALLAALVRAVAAAVDGR